MKLALAHYSSSADISGVTTWFENLVIRLHNDGIEISVHLHHFGEDPESASIFLALVEAGVPVEAVKRARTLEADVRQTLNFLNRAQPTLFLPQCLNAHYFAALIAGRQGLPWALTIHSDDPDYWVVANASAPVGNGGKLVAVSKHIARLTVEHGIDGSPVMIPYGVEVPAQPTKYRGNPFRVVYSGRLVETQKRLSLVVATLVHACEINPDVVATIIGDGPEKGFCQKVIDDAGLGRRIEISGRLTPEQVKNELADTQAILLMSDFEGLPVALLEAMATGVVPVVRSIASGIPELVHHGQTGLVVDDNPRVAARALSSLANDPTLWQACSVAARQLVIDRFSEDVCYQRWLAFIKVLNNESMVQYPLRISRNLDLPTSDPRLYRGYPVQRVWYLRAASRFKQSLGDVSQFFLSR